MLVLSRKPNETLVLPAIETTIQIVAIKPGVVRIGVEAPPDVGVFRSEIFSDAHRAENPSLLAESDRFREALGEIGHTVRNRVNAASIGLALLKRQSEAGMDDAATDTMAKMERELDALLSQVDHAVREAAPAPRKKRSRALLVEDDTNERELLAGFLRMAGIDVSTAADGEDALNRLRADPKPDVMLLDMAMPRCDGPTVLRAIREDRGLTDLRVIAMSGHAPERFNLDPARAGVDRWIHKPVKPEALLRDLGVVLAS